MHFIIYLHSVNWIQSRKDCMLIFHRFHWYQQQSHFPKSPAWAQCVSSGFRGKRRFGLPNQTQSQECVRLFNLTTTSAIDVISALMIHSWRWNNFPPPPSLWKHLSLSHRISSPALTPTRPCTHRRYATHRPARQSVRSINRPICQAVGDLIWEDSRIFLKNSGDGDRIASKPLIVVSSNKRHD